MGGFHAGFMSDEMLLYSDTVLVGDAEDTWGDFLADCVKGAPAHKYISEEKHPLTAVPDVPGIYRHNYYGLGF